VDTHAGSKQTHGISSDYYIAKTSRSDQLPAWNDIQDKPSLVTSSDLSNGLAAKVDKPASAVSGNIAVFDGGPGKLKDGGEKLSDFANINNVSTWVKPGDTIVAEKLDENSTWSYDRELNFYVFRPGKYRITGELKTDSGQTAQLRVIVRFLTYIRSKPGFDVEGINCGEFTTASTSYTPFTIDMVYPVGHGQAIACYIKSNKTYVRNLRLRYADGGESLPVLEV